MSWEISLFYWTGWFAITVLVLGGAATIGSWLLWINYNSRESAFRANAALFAAYLYYTYKYRFRGASIPDMRKMRIDGYEITVTKTDESDKE